MCPLVGSSPPQRFIKLHMLLEIDPLPVKTRKYSPPILAMGLLQTTLTLRAGLLSVMTVMSVLASPPLIHAHANGRVIELLQDFETVAPPTLRAGLPLKVSLPAKGEDGSHCLEVDIPANFNWRWKGWNSDRDQPLPFVSLSALSSPFLPPEADAVRARIWVRSGRALVSVGGPVSQMGCSDVFCDPQLLEASEGWQTVEFSLNHPLIRNFRRANFTKDLPVIAYTRWAQEPLQLFVLALPEEQRLAGETTLLFDQFELIARDEGKPFPNPAHAAIHRSPIVDFNSPSTDLENVCTVAHGYSILDSFEQGYRRRPQAELRAVPEQFQKASPFIREEGIAYPAPRISLVDNEQNTRALRAECVWMEEGQIITFKTKAPSEANAFSCTLQTNLPNLPRNYRFKFNGTDSRAVDFVVFVSPHGPADFPWDAMAPKSELREAFTHSGYTGPGAKFDYLLVSQKNTLATTPDIASAPSFGFYTTRRLLPAEGWSELVVPFSDLMCVYGQGTCADMQRSQQALSPETIAAVGIVLPFGTGHGSILVKSAWFESLPAAEQPLRSYWQPPIAPPPVLQMLRDFGGLRMSLENKGPK